MGQLVEQDAHVWPYEPVLAKWSCTLALVEATRCLVGVDTDVGSLLADEPGSHEPEKLGGDPQPTASGSHIEPLKLAVAAEAAREICGNEPDDRVPSNCHDDGARGLGLMRAQLGGDVAAKASPPVREGSPLGRADLRELFNVGKVGRPVEDTCSIVPLGTVGRHCLLNSHQNPFTKWGEGETAAVVNTTAVVEPSGGCRDGCGPIGPPTPTPLKPHPCPRTKHPLIQGGTVFSSNVAPQRGMKNSREIPLHEGVARR
jgi:hypothetical protein